MEEGSSGLERITEAKSDGEDLNFSQEISDDYLKEVIQQEIVKVSKDYPYAFI